MEAFLDEVSKLDEQLTTPATQLVLDNIKLLKSCHIDCCEGVVSAIKDKVLLSLLMQ